MALVEVNQPLLYTEKTLFNTYSSSSTNIEDEQKTQSEGLLEAFDGSQDSLESYSEVIIQHIELCLASTHFAHQSLSSSLAQKLNLKRSKCFEESEFLQRDEVEVMLKGFDMFLSCKGVENIDFELMKQLLPKLIETSVSYISRQLQPTEFTNRQFTLPFGVPEEEELKPSDDWQTQRAAYQLLLNSTNFYLRRLPRWHPMYIQYQASSNSAAAGGSCGRVIRMDEKDKREKQELKKALDGLNDQISEVIEKCLTKSLLAKLVERMQTEDNNERDTLKVVIHKLYGRFMNFRAEIQKQLFDNFFRVSVEKDAAVLGVSEQLEIFSSIAPGLVQPVKEEHRANFANYILRLLRCDGATFFQNQLILCIKRYVMRDATLAPVVLTHINKYWPHRNTKKQQMFLDVVAGVLEVLEVLENTCVKSEEIIVLRTVQVSMSSRVFYLFNLNLSNDCYLVVEKMLLLWRSSYLLNMINASLEEACEAFVAKLTNAEKNYWHEGIRTLCSEALDIMAKQHPWKFRELQDKALRSEEENKLNAQKLNVMFNKLYVK